MTPTPPAPDVAVVLCSGGMDSSTAAYLARSWWPDADLVLVSADYGQRHRRELDSAGHIAGMLGAEHRIVTLPSLGSSALTNPEVTVPEGHYADESMRATVVPNRNMVLLSIAGSIAVDRGAVDIVLGVHAGDHPVYPDCRPAFASAMETALRVGTDRPITVHAPFVTASKADIAAVGAELGVPWDLTWSCYVGGDRHCGKCGTCVERIEAFAIAGVDDPTEYETKVPT